MSEEYEVPSPHDHVLEHAAEHGRGDSFASTVAITTAILATVGALFAYMAGATQADAALFKNDAAIKKTEAADQWNFFQSKGNKQNLAELAVVLAPPDRQDKFKADAERYAKEKEPIKKQAEALEEQSNQFDERSEHEMHLHHKWAQATTLLQISIALSAIALLTRKKWLLSLVYTFTAIGTVVAGIAFYLTMAT